jgi:alpha-ketoglutarate-dependent taurine dioxygenase
MLLLLSLLAHAHALARTISVEPPLEGRTIGARIYPQHTSGWQPGSITNFTQSDISTIKQAITDYSVVYFPGLKAEMILPSEHLGFARRFGVVEKRMSGAPKYILEGKHMSSHLLTPSGNIHHQTAAATAHTKIPQTTIPTSGAGSTGNSKHGPGNKSMQKANSPEELRRSGLPEEVTRVVTEKTDKLAFGEGWHTDLTHHQAPPRLSIVIGRDLPPTGSTTMFTDMRRAYETLPPDVKEEILPLLAEHDDKAGRSSVHPVVIAHPDDPTCPILFVNSHFTRRIQGYPPGRSVALLAMLHKHVSDLGAQRTPGYLPFHWHPAATAGEGRDTAEVEAEEEGNGHMVIWDEAATQHAATRGAYAGLHRRELQRVLVSGEAPAQFAGQFTVGDEADADDNNTHVPVVQNPDVPKLGFSESRACASLTLAHQAAAFGSII